MRALTVAVMSLAVVGAVHGEPLPVLVLAAEPDDELIARVRGQTVDLEVALAVEDGAPAGTLAAQLKTATARAEAASARIVVWFGREPVLTVFVAEPSRRTVLARTIESDDGGSGGGPSADSAAAEAAALIVRAALRALAVGGKLGVEVPREVALPVDDPELPAPAIHVRHTDSSAWHAAFGWRVTLDGGSAAGQHAASVRLGARRGRMSVGVGFAIGLPASLEDELTSVRLSRHGAIAGLSLRLADGRVWSLDAGLGAGVVAYDRETTARAAGVAATPAALIVGAAGAAELAAALRLGGGLSLRVAIGAELVSPRPELGYERGAGFETRDQLWPVAPWAGISLGLGD